MLDAEERWGVDPLELKDEPDAPPLGEGESEIGLFFTDNPLRDLLGFYQVISHKVVIVSPVAVEGIRITLEAEGLSRAEALRQIEETITDAGFRIVPSERGTSVLLFRDEAQ